MQNTTKNAAAHHHATLNSRRSILFERRKRPSEAVRDSHYVQDTAHKFVAVTIARDSICEHRRVDVDPVQERDSRHLREKKTHVWVSMVGGGMKRGEVPPAQQDIRALDAASDQAG